MTTVEVPVPQGMHPEEFRRYLALAASSQVARDRIASVLEQQDAEIGPATAAQLASVERLWRHLVNRYGVYRSSDIARMRGGTPTNRSIASHLAKAHGLIGLTRGNAKMYPAFEFTGRDPHPQWHAVSRPLVDAGWADQDILLWMVSPNPVLDGQEPAALLGSGDGVDQVRQVVESEAQGVW